MPETNPFFTRRATHRDSVRFPDLGLQSALLRPSQELHFVIRMVSFQLTRAATVRNEIDGAYP